MAIGETGLCIGCMSPMENDGVCPLCGYDNTQPNPPHYLQPGTVLTGRYAVGALESFNSEGATYIGYDGEGDHPVWIREYFPYAISVRDGHSALITPMPGLGAQYKALMSDLVDLCNAVKRLSVSDSVIPIEGMFSANNTLYSVYRKLDVISLEAYLSQVGGRIALKDAVYMFQPLCDTMSNMHARGDLHRGISPQTVYIDRNGKLFLWGFCQAATRTGGSELEAELFNGYSAPEQYASNGWQGPWTDVYALAALFYRTVSGVVPPKSTLVGTQRIVAPLEDLVDDIPKSISDAVSDAMSIAAGDRTQTMAGFSSQLILPDDMVNTAVTAVYGVPSISRDSAQDRSRNRTQGDHEDVPAKNRHEKDSESGVSVKYVLLALVFTVLLLVGVMWFITTNYFPDIFAGGSSSRSSSVVEVSSSEEEEEPSSEEASQEEADKTVPRFVGMQYEDVSSNQDYSSRFTFELKEEFSENYKAGEIFDQSPVEGTLMPNKGTVILTVSKGKRSVTMPDLSGMDMEEAQEEMKKLEEENDNEIVLSLNRIDRYDDKVDPDKIISTMPAAGEEFNPKTTTIYVYVSMKPEVAETREESSKESSKPKDIPINPPKKDPEWPDRDMD